MTLDELEATAEAAAEEARDYARRLANGDAKDDMGDIIVCDMCHCMVLRGYPCWTCEDMGFF